MGSVEEELRRKAEGALRQSSLEELPGSEEDTPRLIHELRVHQIELELQNEELREVRNRAEESLALYRDLYDSSPAAYLSIDRSAAIIRANRAALSLLGRDMGSLVGKTMHSLLVSEARAPMEAFVEEAFRSETPKSFESYLSRDDGERIFVHIVGATKHRTEDECNLALVDITEREALDRAAREKAALIRELQHRVKNNLNVICSLLGIGQGQLEDPKAVAVLEKARARVMAMSHIYEQLYRTEEVLDVDLWLYLEHLIGPLLETYAVDSSRFRLVKEFQSVKIDAQRAALAGLMFSELISNATKYAYPDGASGELRVSLLQKDGSIEMSVADDGPGLPEGFDYRESKSMGFTLLRMLSMQMRADLVVESPPRGGVSVTLRIRP
jgi:PAS domain S-box-containing protein